MRIRAGRLLLFAAFTLGATACSTSGRELPAPAASNTTLPASISGASTTGGATAATPVEGLDGFALSSPSFVAGGELPVDAGAETGNRSPALSWTSTPESAAELSLVVTDETGGIIYWFVTGVLTTDSDVAAGAVPLDGVEQANSTGSIGWSGPVPEAGASASVVFALYALDEPLVTVPGETSQALRERVIAGSFATASLRGTFDGTGNSLQSGG